VRALVAQDDQAGYVQWLSAENDRGAPDALYSWGRGDPPIEPERSGEGTGFEVDRSAALSGHGGASPQSVAFWQRIDWAPYFLVYAIPGQCTAFEPAQIEWVRLIFALSLMQNARLVEPILIGSQVQNLVPAIFRAGLNYFLRRISRNRLKSQSIRILYGDEVAHAWSSKEARVHDHTEMDFAFRVELLHTNCRPLPPLLVSAAIWAAEDLSK